MALVTAVGCHVALGLAAAYSREPLHDEGVTADQVLGQLKLDVSDTGRPIREMYDPLESRSLASASEVLAALQTRGMHPPAYYLLLGRWVRLAGTGRVALRLPSLVAGVLSVVAIERLARLVLSESAAPWTALLMALSPWHVRIASYARPYSLALAIALLTTVLMVRLLVGNARHPRLAFSVYVVLSLVGLYCAYQHLFVLAWQAASALLFAGTHRAALRRILMAMAGIAATLALGFLPWLPTLLRHLDVTSQGKFYFSGAMPLARWPVGLAELLRKFLFADMNVHLASALSVLVIGVCGLAVAWRVASKAPWPPHAPRQPWFWLASPLLPTLMATADLWHDTRTLFISKTSYALFPLLLFALTSALFAAPRAWFRRAAMAGTCALFAIAGSFRGYRVARSDTDCGRIARWLKANDVSEHLLVLDGSGRGFVYPLFMVLREHGVRNVRVSLMGPASDVVGRSGGRLGGARRVTVVQFWTGRAADPLDDVARGSVAVFRGVTPAGWFD